MSDIKKGDEVEILPEWQDEGDGNYTWVAVSDVEKGRLDIRPKDCPMALAPVYTMKEEWVRKAQPCSRFKKLVLELYTPPFEFQSGYIFDSSGNMVADQGGVGGADKMLAQIRGWGRIGKMEDAEAVQDAVGHVVAQALTLYWEENCPKVWQ